MSTPDTTTAIANLDNAIVELARRVERLAGVADEFEYLREVLDDERAARRRLEQRLERLEAGT